MPYFQLVFTLPSELRPIVTMNREHMFALMFEAASKSPSAQPGKRVRALYEPPVGAPASRSHLASATSSPISP